MIKLHSRVAFGRSERPTKLRAKLEFAANLAARAVRRPPVTYLRLALVLGLDCVARMGSMGRVYFPALYPTVHTIISVLLYFGLGSRLYEAIETVLFAHPILLFGVS